MSLAPACLVAFALPTLVVFAALGVDELPFAFL